MTGTYWEHSTAITWLPAKYSWCIFVNNVDGFDEVFQYIPKAKPRVNRFGYIFVRCALRMFISEYCSCGLMNQRRRPDSRRPDTDSHASRDNYGATASLMNGCVINYQYHRCRYVRILTGRTPIKYRMFSTNVCRLFRILLSTWNIHYMIFTNTTIITFETYNYLLN